MNRRRVLSLLTCFILTFLIAVGCNQISPDAISETSNAQLEPSELTVSAAASMQDAMKAVGEMYQQEHPNTIINYNFGSSGSLQQQIEQGAPVDVFISAAEKQMNALEAKGLLLEGTRQNLLKNEVVLIVALNNSLDITDFQDLSSSKVERFSLGEPESVPAGQYGKEVLTSLNIYDEIQSKTVFAKDVRQVLSYVETGNVDAGIVYGTDAKVSDKVKVIATASADTHKPIIYPVAVIKNTQNTEAAKEFVAFLLSEKAQAKFEEYGFKRN
ncbi:molybdate ABC transporter substrate-binding protein [Oscillatoria salina]|uniref:molybdate ABC transporter substrate-binding protein n=1 Tax=Oscillatoria salina TaxID=331517 RepID=UPI0013BDAA4F|nr:molybdate ABC transporter substrate-binding protein [Oscillatoria salina]MBZ8178862.1 molybdate ABC transporter substrate-binding protein [Oscillatoria salina IIICB1]NET91295.1 molybdate ABC transporter substrate-binding protein [Kamptonema sp. SIO1D9]